MAGYSREAMGALVYSQGALWTHSSLTNISSTPFGNRTRSGPQSLALPSLILHGGWKSGIAAERRHLNTRVSPPTSNSVRLRLPPSNSPSAMLMSHRLDVFSTDWVRICHIGLGCFYVESANNVVNQ